MKKLWKDIYAFLSCKVYIVSMMIIAICAYGFAITHHSVGMDDTAVFMYFEEGLAPYVGRWTLYVLNQIVDISSFLPWIVEFVSVVILFFSVTLWCVLWQRAVGKEDAMPRWSYAFVGGIFISCPLISEVFVFYLHNGICIGYGLTALALIEFMEVVNKGIRKGWKELILASVFSSVAIGCYESFAAVYIIGALTCFLVVRTKEREQGAVINSSLLVWLESGVLSLGMSLLIRMTVLRVIKCFVNGEKFADYTVLYRSAFGDIFTTPGELAMVLKRFYAMYCVNGIVYLPIAVLCVSMVVCVLYSLYRGIQHKDCGILLSVIAMFVAPVFMSILEGNVTRYRSAQYVPVVCAFSVVLILQQLERVKRDVLKWVAYLLGIVLIFNQCVDMNKWFWVDYLKYQDVKRVMDQVAYDIESSCDISKPIVFRGGYEVPNSIRNVAYVSFGSKAHQRISKLLDPIDVHLQEKYWDSLGYNFVEGPNISTLQWGVTAFDGTSQQLIEFWRMHGIGELYCATDLEMIEEAQAVMTENDMPGYPENGYVREFEDYIIVNLSHSE